MSNARKVFESVDIEGLHQVAKFVAEQVRAIPVWLFHGEMGSGKTTLIKEICRVLGVHDAMSSPTFSIVNEYVFGTGKIYHFDFYRLKHEREALDIGTEEYFYSGYPCLLEWPEKIPSLLPDTYGEVNISITNETHRDIAILIHDGEEKNRL